jgi:hypothetical protein
MAARFPTTRWSRIVRAGDPGDPVARTAHEGPCRDYWFPLYAFIRRHGVSADNAEDIVQGFVVRSPPAGVTGRQPGSVVRHDRR